MFEALRGIACFVTVSVCLLYGTRIACCCGKKCNFKVDPSIRKQALMQSMPMATLIYFFGLMIVFSLLMDGFVTIVLISLTSAILLAGLMVSTTMPELKSNRMAHTKGRH